MDKKKKKYFLQHLDDARDERDNKWAEGAKGLAGALIGEDEPQSDLGSLADIIENIAIIKRTFDNNKKLGEETKDVKIEHVAKDFSAYYDLDPSVDFANRTDDASQNFFKHFQNLDPKDPKHNLLAKIVGTNILTSRGSREENTNYQMMRKTADERQKRRMEDTLAKGNPLKQFELDKQRSGKNIPAGTPVNELFKTVSYTHLTLPTSDLV